MELLPGQIVEGRYETVSFIGQGAFASVYKVRHRALQSCHALKVLEPHLARDQELRNRFLAEGRIQASLRHPHIVSVTDIVTDPVAGLVMEYVDGGSLDEWLLARPERPTPELIKAIMLPVLDAVGAAHAKGIVHRDLKPGNILVELTRHGEVFPVVTDFGIAKILDGGMDVGKKRTAVGTRLGTVEYMSPEQVRASSDIDHRSDIFSLGAILYEVVTGKVAFEADSEFDTMHRIVDEDFSPIERVAEDLDPTIAACIARAMAVGREERFQDCDSMIRALRCANKDGHQLSVESSPLAAATQQPVPAHRDLQVNLFAPLVRVGLSRYSFDPLAKYLGAPLGSFLEEYLSAPAFERKSLSGAKVRVFPLCLPNGGEVIIPLPGLGEFALHNDRGILVLTIPTPASRRLCQDLEGAIERGPKECLSSTGTTRVKQVWVNLHDGLSASIPLGKFGEVGFETGLY